MFVRDDQQSFFVCFHLRKNETSKIILVFFKEKKISVCFKEKVCLKPLFLEEALTAKLFNTHIFLFLFEEVVV